MGKKRLALALAVVMVFSVITGNTVPAFGEIKTAPNDGSDILFKGNGEETEYNEGGGEYVEGEIILAFQPDEYASGALLPEHAASVSNAAKALMEQSEDLMDISRGVALAEEEETSGSSVITAEGSVLPDESTVLKLIHSDRYSTDELLEMYEDYPGVLFAEPNYICRISEELGEDGSISEELLEEGPINEEMIVEDIGSDIFESDAGTYAASKDGYIPAADTANVEYNPDLTGFQYANGIGLGGIGVPDWNTTIKNSDGVVVAVIDTGVDYDHPDLASVMWDDGLEYEALKEMGGGKYGINTASEINGRPTTDPDDYHHHGTHCAGIIAAAWNGKGVSGVANGAKIMAIRHSDDRGMSYTSYTIRGFAYVKKAKELGVNVVAVNNSWGANGGTDILFGYVTRELEAAGIVSCYAAGNDDANNDIHVHTASVLADIPGAIIVGANTDKGERADFSDYGIRSAHIFAPGENILSTYPLEQAKAFADMTISAPAKDSAGDEVKDDYKIADTYFSLSANGAVNATCTQQSDYLEITGVDLKSPDQLDDITKETMKEVPPTAGYNATICTLTGAAPISDAKPLYFCITGKMTSGGGQIDEALKVYVKTVEGKWDRPALSPFLGSDYNTECYNLSAGIATGAPFDLDNIEIRLVAYRPTQTFEEIDLRELWITDADPVPYAYSNGTSMAAPAAVGAIAVIARKFPGDSAAMRAARLLAGAKPVAGYDEMCITGGMVNLANSLDVTKYTPVIRDITVDKDGLHLYGFFFGDNSPDVQIDQGGMIFKTADSSLSELDYKTTVDGGNEVLYELPQGLKTGELTVKVTNNAASVGRKDYTRIMTLEDPYGCLVPFYTQLPTPDALGMLNLISMVAVDRDLIVTGWNDLSDERETWKCSPAGVGEWEKLPVAATHIKKGNVIAWNKKLLYINVYGELCIQDVETGDTDKGFLVLEDRTVSSREGYTLYYDGERVIMLFSPIIDAKTEERAATQVWEVDPGLFTAVYLGTLNGCYGGSKAPVVAHDTDANGNTAGYYVFGIDSLSMDDKPEMEYFTPGTFTSKKIALKYPDDGTKMVFSQLYDEKDTGLYSGCAYKGGMMVTGIFRVDDKAKKNPVILDDNYFISFADPDHKVVPAVQRMAPTMMFSNITCAYKGMVYMMGPQEGNSRKFALSTTAVNTWPAFGDDIIMPDDPSEATDTSVKLKKLTMVPKKITLTSGETKKLGCIPVFKDKDVTAALVYGTSNSDVVVVAADGTVYARDMGTAIITAYCGNKKATCKVTVNGKAFPELNKTTTTLSVGEKDLLFLTNAVSTGKEKITWKSTDKKVVSVSKGLLIPKNPGTAEIRVTWKNGKERENLTCKVVVSGNAIPEAVTNDKGVKLSVRKSAGTINRNKTAELTATLTGDNYNHRYVVYKALNPNVADFGDAGDEITVSGGNLKELSPTRGQTRALLKGQSAGIAYVAVESYDEENEDTDAVNRRILKITVNAPAEEIKITGDSSVYKIGMQDPGLIEMKSGSSVAVSYSLEPEVCTDYTKVKWSVKKGGTVTVKNGIITAKKASLKDRKGNVIPSVVTVTCGTKTAEIKVIVR